MHCHPNPTSRRLSRNSRVVAWAAACSAALAGGNAFAVPLVGFEPVTQTAATGQVFEVSLVGRDFSVTGNGLAIGNLTGGQKLNFSFDSTVFDVEQIRIDPRWSFSAGNSAGRIDTGLGQVTGLAFGSFPAVTDDDFTIATFTLRAAAPGQGRLTLLSGQFIGLVGGRAAQLITPTFNPLVLTVSAVPEPTTGWLLALGLVAAWLAVGAGRRVAATRRNRS